MSEDQTPEIENTASHDESADSSPAPEANNDNVEGSATETPEPKKVNKVQERINQLTREKYEERQRNAELEARIKSLESSTPKVDPVVADAPKEDDFEEYSDFLAAQAKFVAETASNAAYERIKAEQAQASETVEQQERLKELTAKKKVFEEKLAEKRDNFEDFEAVAYSHPFMDTEMAEVIFDLDNSVEVAYHIGSNLEEAERIFAMSPVQRARELTKLDMTVTPLKPKRVSDAPDPITPLGNSEVVQPDPDKMTADEWRIWRNKQKYG